MNSYRLYTIFLATISFFILNAEKTYTLEIGQFEKLKVSTNVNIIYKNLPDSTGMARYVAPEGHDNLFLITNKNNVTLRIQSQDTQWTKGVLPTLYLYSNFLTEVESSSDLVVDIESVAPCATFNVNQIGNGTIDVENVNCNNLSASITTGNGVINISGICVEASFRMIGTGLIAADRLRADKVNCKILGTGSIGCWPIDNLNVKGLGTTKIYYKGKPDIRKSGGGKLFELPVNQDFDKSGAEVKSFLPTDECDSSQE